MFTFIIVDYDKQRNIYVTKSPSMARRQLYIGRRIEVWGKSGLVETIHDRDVAKLRPYMDEERAFRGVRVGGCGHEFE